MALTLLDIAKRTGSDSVIGVIEENLIHAPEFYTLPVRTVQGTTYKATLRTALPQGGFRKANAGIQISSSQYEQKTVNCFFWDVQMEVDEQIVDADPGELHDVLATEASGAFEGSIVSIGSQIYYGTDANAEGFSGFVGNVDPSMVVNAGGTGNETTSAWFVYEHEQGVHIPVGNNGLLQMKEWREAPVRDSKGGKYTAWHNNFKGFIGLNIGSKYSIGRIKNITADKPLNDQLGALMLSKFPAGRRPTRVFINRVGAYLLQNSRSAVGMVESDKGGRGAYAPLPEEIQGIPVVVTDSITTTEKATA